MFQAVAKCLIESIPGQLNKKDFDFLSNPEVSIQDKFNYLNKLDFINFEKFDKCLAKNNIKANDVFKYGSEMILCSVTKTLISIRLEGKNAPKSLIEELETGSCSCILEKYKDNLLDIDKVIFLTSSNIFFKEFDTCLLKTLKSINQKHN
jgi:hypothetical protein